MSSASFQDAASATSDASGAYAVVFQSVRLGYIWTGSVQIPSAVSSSVLPVKFTAFDSGIPIGSWYNDQSSPDLQVQQQLSITASGLATSTRFQAFFKGMITPAAETPPFWPGPTPAPPLGTPQLLAIVGKNIAPADTVVTVGSAPVIVGTSVEITCSFADNPAQLEVMWGTVAGSNLLGYFTFDLAASALVKGLVLPNLGPVITVKAITHAASTGMSLTMFTGLPPIVRPPMIPNGVLLAAQGNIGANAGVSIPFLVPYTGPAVLSVLLQNSAGAAGTHAFFVDCNGVDYSNTSLSWAHAIVDYVSDNNTVQAAVIQPRTIHVPPLINSVVLTSQNPNTLGYTVSIVALGP